jgi:hypothetical protein
MGKSKDEEMCFATYDGELSQLGPGFFHVKLDTVDYVWNTLGLLVHSLLMFIHNLLYSCALS